MVSPDFSNSSGGTISRAALSKQSPMAQSVVDPSTRCLVRDSELMTKVWPPEIRTDKNGNSGSAGGTVVPDLKRSRTEDLYDLGFWARAETSLGVRAWACIWCTPTRGMFQATARPLAVSRPVKRFARMPGPRVTEMKSGIWRYSISRGATLWQTS